MALVSTNFLLVLCAAWAQVSTANTDHLALADFTVQLARQFFSKQSNTLVIVAKSELSSASVVNAEILGYILLHLEETVAVQLFFGEPLNQPWEYHIFIVDNAKSFTAIRWNFTSSCYDNKYHFIIVLTTYSPEYLLTLHRIFSFCYRLHVINVNIVLSHPSDGISMYTYKLFTQKICRSIQPVRYFRLSDGLENLTRVFPPKLQNFHQCPLRVTAQESQPMVKFSGNKSDPKQVGCWDNLKGIEADLLKLISQALNFTIVLLPFPTEPTSFHNRTAHGCFAELMSGKADIAIGGYSASDPLRCLLSTSEHYHHSPVVFTVRGGRKLSSISRLARPFEPQVWYILALVVISSAVFIHALRTAAGPAIQQLVFGERNETPLTNFLAVLLGYPIVQQPGRNFSRFLLLLWLLMALILRSAYQGALYDSIRMDGFVRIPMGYTDLRQWNYKIIVPEYMDELEMFPKNQTVVVEGEHGNRLKMLESMHGRYATVVLKDHFVDYMRRHFRIGSKLKMLNEPVFVYMNAMYFGKHSIYTKTINSRLRRFQSAGLISYIAKHNAEEVSVFKEQKHGVPLKAISCDELRGLFEIFLGMMALAVFVFALELTSVYCRKLGHLIEWIN